MRIALLSNDVVPGMGLPVAAPGLRSWGLALGLRALGHDVTLAVDGWQTRRIWRDAVPPPLPPGCVVLNAGQVAAWVRERGIDVLVICNSNHADRLGDLGRCRLVYDFFAPKMLEIAENSEREDLDEALALLEARKLRALARSSGVIVNGAKKLDYVRDWTARAGVPDLPLAVVNPGLPALAPDPAPTPRLQLIVSGYIQPWSRPGAWLDAVLPLLDEGLAELHLIVGEHWAPRAGASGTATSDVVERLAGHPRVVRHGLLDLPDFRRLLSRCHLSIDVFERNPERELAMVTRSVVALSAGLPTMHVDFSEVSPLIAAHDAGWLVDEQDAEQMEGVLRAVVADRSLLDVKRAGARALAATVLDPATAAAPLHELLHELLHDLPA